MELKFEQSDKECCTDTAGLYFVGKALNKNTSLRQELKKVKKRHGISNMDLVRSYEGSEGKNIRLQFQGTYP